MKDKRKKFIELAESRVNRAIKDMRLIGNLSNRSAYEFTEQDVKQIFRSLQTALDTARGRFGDKADGRETEFKLGG